MVFRAGFSAVDITPDTPVTLAGFGGRIQPSIGVRDPIFCRGLALEQGGERLLVLALDLLNCTPAQDREFRSYLAQAIGLAPEKIIVACLHPHSAPALFAFDRCYDGNDEYVEWLKPRMAEAARMALKDAKPLRASLGTARPCGAAYNRRQLRTDGTMQLAYEPDASKVAGEGPFDNRLQALAFEDESGALSALVVHYCCHPVVLGGANRKVSADYIGELIQRLARQTGLPQNRIVFWNGAHGDINPMRLEDSEKALGKVADALADAAMKALETRQPMQIDSLRAVSGRVELDFEAPGPEFLRETIVAGERALARVPAAAERLANEQGVSLEQALGSLGGQHETKIRWARRGLDLHEKQQQQPPAQADLTLFRAGPLCLLASPFETFTQIALDAEAALGAPCWLLSNANGCFGYLPSDEAWEHPIGYEFSNSHIWYGNPGPFARGSAARLNRAWRDLAARAPRPEGSAQ